MVASEDPLAMPRLYTHWKNKSTQVFFLFISEGMLEESVLRMLKPENVDIHNWMCPLHSYSYVETLTCSVAVFGDEASKGIIKIKWGRKGGAPIR